jgi:hypothetical protein
MIVLETSLDLALAMNDTFVVFDCEADPMDGRQFGVQAERMQCTCACLASAPLHFATAGKRVPQPETVRELTCWRDRRGKDGSAPFEQILIEFDRAKVICGYNIVNFDFPLLRRYYGKTAGSDRRYMSHLSKTWDPIIYLFQVTGVMFKLSDLLRWNGMSEKTASGAKAVEMWTANQRRELERYCQMDVLLTMQLCCMQSVIAVVRGQRVTIPLPSPASGRMCQGEHWTVQRLDTETL